MYWADRVVKQIIDSGNHEPYVVDDMATPSGYPHVGSLKGPLVHDFVYRSLKDTGKEVRFTFVFNDFDPIDGLPEELEDDFSRYMGFPLRNVPSPDNIEGKSFADFFSDDYKKVIEGLGVKAEYLSSWDLYHQGKFNEVIKEALDNADKIQDVYQKISGSQKKQSGWLPLQVICEDCGRIGTTRVHGWDGEMVEYTCEPNLVKWAAGCGHNGKISPFDGNGKLPWKVDWPAHWKVIGITIEGAGKDHSVAGGSRDIARELCKDIFHYPEPFNLPYEFIIIGGKKMSSSKGLGLKARDLTGLLPPELGRFLFARTDYRQASEFNPNETMAIPDLFDEYDRCYRAFVDQDEEEFARAFEISQIEKIPERVALFIPRFRDVVNYLQTAPNNILERFEESKGSDLNDREIEILEERTKYAKIWLEKYAPDEFKFGITADLPSQASNLTKEQKQYLEAALVLINKDLAADDLQQELYELSKVQAISTKEAFQAIYVSLIGKDHGPKAGVLLTTLPKEDVVKRFMEVASE